MTQPTAGLVCPNGHPSEESDYCSVCGAPMPGTAAPAPPPPPAASDPAAAPMPTGRAEWEVTIAIDATLDVEPDPGAPAPPDVGDRIFPIDLPEMLVGRRDDAHHIRPEIPVIDPGVSRRHAHFLRLPEGRVAIVDLA